MTKRTNKHYPAEFKQEAVALVIEQDYSIGPNRPQGYTIGIGHETHF